MRLLLLLLLAGCPQAPIGGEACATGEVACGFRVLDPQRVETRCFMVCRGSQWTFEECLPECGAGRALETGANGSSCELPAVQCTQ